MTENELHRLRTTFDSVASQYDMARPDYPAPMYDDIRALHGGHITVQYLTILSIAHRNS